MILSQIGEVRLGAGVIRKAKSPRLGFSQPYEISYGGLKLPRVSAALGRSHLRSGADLPQVAGPSEGLPPVIRPARISHAGTDQPLAIIENRSVCAVSGC
jgi:hypothetical protein